MKFTDLKLNPAIIRSLSENNIVSPTDIQYQSINTMLSHPDTNIIGQAKTGSGKTLAFAIPMIEKFDSNNKNIQILVMVPTRELCKQVSSVFQSITKYKKANIVEIYGGVSYKNQIQKIRNNGQIVIATPGRLIDLFHQRKINLEKVKYVAIDEADRMLDMGFLPDMEIILLQAMKYNKPQLFLFSATLLDDLKKLVNRFSKGKHISEINISKDELTVAKCDQRVYTISSSKYRALVTLLKVEKPDYSIIFTKTKRKSEELCKKLKREYHMGISFGVLNGDLSQSKREKIIEKFRSKRINCLIGTNVLARGLDFPQVSHVINYDMPRDPEDYIHRIGRTARVSGAEKSTASGKAISIVNSNDKMLLKKVERLIKVRIKKYPVPTLPKATPEEIKEREEYRLLVRARKQQKLVQSGNIKLESHGKHNSHSNKFHKDSKSSNFSKSSKNDRRKNRSAKSNPRSKHPAEYYRKKSQSHGERTQKYPYSKKSGSKKIESRETSSNSPTLNEKKNQKKSKKTGSKDFYSKNKSRTNNYRKYKTSNHSQRRKPKRRNPKTKIVFKNPVNA